MKMACVENIPPLQADSEMEEGEIVDDLSDISSEEEFLLRQRLQVLENYNNVLERKKAKRSSIGPGTKFKIQKEDALLDLSEISATELDDFCTNTPQKQIKVQKRQRIHHRQKRKKEEPIVPMKTKDHRKKTHHSKKKLEVKIISESSEESDDEYRNRRRKLADAVIVNKNTNKSDKTSLSERLRKMFCSVHPEPVNSISVNINKTDTEDDSKVQKSNISSITLLNNNTLVNTEVHMQQTIIPEKANSCEFIDLCTDEDSKTIGTDLPQDTVDSVSKEHENEEETKEMKESLDKDDLTKDSDDDLELLRQHALKTKAVKAKVDEPDHKILSEDEDSDTAELRLICLKSALLKKAIERKQKQKLKKRLSQSNFPDNFLNADNNTDIESVDMDIDGSDNDEKAKENTESIKEDVSENNTVSIQTKSVQKEISIMAVQDNDELEDDEDLLRAKLLTSLSKNLPNLVNPCVIDAIENITDKRPLSPKEPQVTPVVHTIDVPEEKRIIINLGESDSEGEHEATKNLTKMHMKLSEQKDFQQRLDMFLKSTRMEVEKTTKLPDVVQQPPPPKKNEKFVAKAVKHLPKSEQIEYKNLVKRMAELEKIKQARQSTMNLPNKPIGLPSKETLKPRNATIDASKFSAINNLEEKIKLSRKHIAEESAKILKLKEEGLKLSQKYKIVATELRNIKTAIALNKKQTRSVQNCLTQIRLHHQMLLKSSMTSTHSKINGYMNLMHTKLQKENNPVKEENKAPSLLKTGKPNVKENQLETGKKVVGIEKVEQKNPVVQRSVKDTNLAKEEQTKNAITLKQTKVPVIETNKVISESNPVTPLPAKPGEKETPPTHPRLSVQLDVTSNKKLIKVSNDNTKSNDNGQLNVDNKDKNEDLMENERLSSHPVEEKGGGNKDIGAVHHTRVVNDEYRSPLDAFGSTTWEGDPNAILCPFEVGGDCKDADCIYLHTKTRSK